MNRGHPLSRPRRSQDKRTPRSTSHLPPPWGMWRPRCKEKKRPGNMQESAHPGRPLSGSEGTRKPPHAPHERRGGFAWGGYLERPRRRLGTTPRHSRPEPGRPNKGRGRNKGREPPATQTRGKKKRKRAGARRGAFVGNVRQSRGVTRRGEGLRGFAGAIPCFPL